MPAKLLCAIFIAFFPGWIFCQELQSEVFSGAGDSFQGSAAAITWALGEPVVEIFSNGNTISQGFIQNLDAATPVFERKDLDFRLDIFPNPASRFLTVQTDSPVQLDLDLYDLFGRRLLSASTNETINQLDLESMPPGTYLLRVKDSYGAVGAFRIIKTSN